MKISWGVIRKKCLERLCRVTVMNKGLETLPVTHYPVSIIINFLPPFIFITDIVKSISKQTPDILFHL